VLSRGLDVHGIDAFFNGLGELTKQAAAALRRVQNGFVRSYALAVLAGVVIIIGYLILK
jgi:NADH-quinone oxidoreductase subunit L